MLSNALSNPLLWAVLAVVLIVRQFLPRPVRSRTLVAVPLVAGFLGVQALVSAPPGGAFGVALLGFDIVLGTASGAVGPSALPPRGGGSGWGVAPRDHPARASSSASSP